jgi:hypothetical protein
MSFHDRDFGRKNAGSRLDDATELNEVVAALKARDAEITDFATKAAAEIKANGQMATETKSALDKLSTDGAGLADRLLAVEQKLSRRGGIETPQSLGPRSAICCCPAAPRATRSSMSKRPASPTLRPHAPSLALSHSPR